MTTSRIAVGLQIPGNPPLGMAKTLLMLARLIRFDSALVPDHFQGLIPSAIWDLDFTWVAGQFTNPHENFDFQVLLGYLAASAGRVRLGVGVTEPIRRHPVLIAQAMVTLALATRRAPILGIGAGERENIEPYGLDFSTPVAHLEEALEVIRLCFAREGTIDYRGKHFQLDGAIMSLKPPKNRLPHVWIAGHGPRMLRLTGKYGDGWFPTHVLSPADYAAKLALIRAAATDAGRDPAAIMPALHQYIVVAPTDRQARAMLTTRAAKFSALMFSTTDQWRQLGKVHPLGEQFRGYVDFIPERYDRTTLDAAIAAVPRELLGSGLMWGTPLQIVEKLRAFGDAGLRHVVLDLASALSSRGAAAYGVFALARIGAMLRNGT